MRRLGIPPTKGDWEQTVWDRLNVYTGTSNPTAAEVPEGQWVIFNNTALGEVRIWTNVAGVMKKSAAFT